MDQYEAGVTPCTLGPREVATLLSWCQSVYALIDTIPTECATILKIRFLGALRRDLNYIEGVFTLNTHLTSFDYLLDFKLATAVLAGSDTIDRYEQAIRNRDGCKLKCTNEHTFYHPTDIRRE